MYTLELCSGICDDVDEDALTYPAEGHISFIADPHAVPRLNPTDQYSSLRHSSHSSRLICPVAYRLVAS